MTTQHPDGAARDERARSRVDEAQDAATPDPPEQDAPVGDEVVPPKQIHRWKGEGGALHPDD